jgi:hypothetical protein
MDAVALGLRTIHACIVYATQVAVQIEHAAIYL